MLRNTKARDLSDLNTGKKKKKKKKMSKSPLTTKMFVVSDIFILDPKK